MEKRNWGDADFMTVIQKGSTPPLPPAGDHAGPDRTYRDPIAPPPITFEYYSSLE